MKAAIYSRKSVFTGKGESIENQVQMCKEYGEKNLGIKDFIIYEDEGFSGGNINRPNFQELLQDVKHKKFDVLICYRLDRISRNVADFSTTLELLQSHSVAFVSIKEQFDTSTPMGKAMVYIASVFAQLERETIAERIKDNMLQLAKTGRWLGGQCPLGFKSEKITYFDDEMNEKSMNKLSPVSDELKLVKLLYDKYLQTGSIHKVQKFCLENSVKGKNGGQITSMSIGDILRNTAYVKSNDKVFAYLESKGINTCGEPNGNGILTYNKKDSKYMYKDTNEWIAAVAKHKGVVDSSDWLEVQLLLDKNKKKENIRQGTSKRSLLSGVLKCAICGAPMRISYGRAKKNGSERTYYYMCTLKAHSGKTRCDNPNVKGTYIENAVVENIMLNIEHILKEIENAKKNLDKSTENASVNINKEIETKTKQMNKLLEQLSFAEDTAAEFIMAKVEDLGKEIKTLKLKLNNSESKSQEILQQKINLELREKALQDFALYFYKIKDIEKRRLLLETAVDKITWNGNTEDVDVDLWGSKKK